MLCACHTLFTRWLTDAGMLQSLAVFSKTHAALQALYAQQLMENDDTHKPEVNHKQTFDVACLVHQPACTFSLILPILNSYMALQFDKLIRYPPYKAVYDSVSTKLAAKGKRPDGDRDSLDNIGQETFSTAQIQQLNNHMLSENQTDADRDHALNMWLYNSVGESDDGRLVHQPDFLPPRQIKSIGAAQCMLCCAC